jgi:hypothetical protein
MPFVLLLVFLLYVVVVATCYSSHVAFLHYYCYSCRFLTCHCCLGYFFALLLLFVLCSHIAMLFALFSCTSIVFLLFALPTCIALVAHTTFLRFQSSWVIVAIVVVTIVFLVLPFHIVTLLMSFLSHYSSHIIIFLALLFLLCFFFSHCCSFCVSFLALLFLSHYSICTIAFIVLFFGIIIPIMLIFLHCHSFCVAIPLALLFSHYCSSCISTIYWISLCCYYCIIVVVVLTLFQLCFFG